MFKQLSFHHDKLDTRNIFYGDWQYDTLHGRANQYQGEFGDVITEPNAGPQPSFIDDFFYGDYRGAKTSLTGHWSVSPLYLGINVSRFEDTVDNGDCSCIWHRYQSDKFLLHLIQLSRSRNPQRRIQCPLQSGKESSNDSTKSSHDRDGSSPSESRVRLCAFVVEGLSTFSYCSTACAKPLQFPLISPASTYASMIAKPMFSRVISSHPAMTALNSPPQNQCAALPNNTTLP